MQVHDVDTALNSFQCLLVLLLTAFNQVLCQLENCLLRRLKFLRCVEVSLENVLSSLLTLLLFVHFSDVLHVDQIADLFVEKHVEYFEGEDTQFL